MRRVVEEDAEGLGALGALAEVIGSPRQGLANRREQGDYFFSSGFSPLAFAPWVTAKLMLR